MRKQHGMHCTRGLAKNEMGMKINSIVSSVENRETLKKLLGNHKVLALPTCHENHSSNANSKSRGSETCQGVLCEDIELEMLWQGKRIIFLSRVARINGKVKFQHVFLVFLVT